MALDPNFGKRERAGAQQGLDRGQVSVGLTVLSHDGHKIGRVSRCSKNSFAVEKGLMFKETLFFLYDQVECLRNSQIILEFSKSQINATTARLRQNPDDTKASAQSDPRNLSPESFETIGSRGNTKTVYSHTGASDLTRVSDEFASTDLNSDGSIGNQPFPSSDSDREPPPAHSNSH